MKFKETPPSENEMIDLQGLFGNVGTLRQYYVNYILTNSGEQDISVNIPSVGFQPEQNLNIQKGTTGRKVNIISLATQKPPPVRIELQAPYNKIIPAYLNYSENVESQTFDVGAAYKASEPGTENSKRYYFNYAFTNSYDKDINIKIPKIGFNPEQNLNIQKGSFGNENRVYVENFYTGNPVPVKVELQEAGGEIVSVDLNFSNNPEMQTFDVGASYKAMKQTGGTNATTKYYFNYELKNSGDKDITVKIPIIGFSPEQNMTVQRGSVGNRIYVEHSFTASPEPVKVELQESGGQIIPIDFPFSATSEMKSFDVGAAYKGNGSQNAGGGNGSVIVTPKKYFFNYILSNSADRDINVKIPSVGFNPEKSLSIQKGSSGNQIYFENFSSEKPISFKVELQDPNGLIIPVDMSFSESAEAQYFDVGSPFKEHVFNGPTTPYPGGKLSETFVSRYSRIDEVKFVEDSL